MALPAGIEPATYGLEVRRSLQLSYGSLAALDLRQWPAFYGTHLARAALKTARPGGFKYDSFITELGAKVSNL